MKVQLPHLDSMLCWACGLKCVGCTNAVTILPQEIFPMDEIVRDLELAHEVMHAETVCLLGGEPTVHKDLVPIMREAKRIGLGDRIQVLTNGMRLHKMNPEFWAELQSLKVSIYPNKTQPENIELAERMSAEHGFELSFYDVAADPFRAVITDRARSALGAQRTYDGCWYRQFTRKLERGFFYRCCTSPSISQTVLGLPPDADGIALDGLTPDALREFLGRTEPMASCFRCFGHTGPRLGEWSEERDRDQWLAASAVPIPPSEVAAA